MVMNARRDGADPAVDGRADARGLRLACSTGADHDREPEPNDE